MISTDNQITDKLLAQKMQEIDDFVAKASAEQLRAKRDWGSLQFDVAEYAVRRCNDRLRELGEEIF